MESPLFQTFLKHFYQTSTGKFFWENEKKLIDEAIKHVFGYFSLQVGLTSQACLLENCRVSNQVLVDNAIDPLQKKYFKAQIVADIDYLPFKKDTLDLVFLPHTLEAVEDPYHILREADTLIVPDGCLLISGFNPFGFGVLKQKIKYRNLHQHFKHAHLIHPKRLVDWLKLLGYEIEYIQLSPIRSQTGGMLNKIGQVLSFLGLETGSIYVIQARKKVSSPTPVGLNWKLSQLLPLRKGQTVLASKVPYKNLVNDETVVRKRDEKK